MTRTAVVIVSHRSAARIGALLDSLTRFEPQAPLVLVDNASPEGPPPVPDGGTVLALDDNLGYGAACNRGAAAALEDPAVTALAFLNPDVRLQGPSLTELDTALAAHPDVGIATGPLVDEHDERVASAWGETSSLRALWFASGLQLRRLRNLAGRLRGSGALTSSTTLVNDDVAVEGHVLGGAMVVRRDCWEQLGGFDEDYFLYWEDADLCRRALRAGWSIRVLPCTPMVHESGTSSEGVADEQRWQWYLDGAETFARKHLSAGSRRRLLAALRLGRKLSPRR